MARVYNRISADSHIEVPSERWTHRIDPKYRDRGPKSVALPDGADGTVLGDLPPRQNPMDLYGGKGRDTWLPYGQHYDDTPGTGPPEQRVKEQDIDGTDAEVLFPAVVTGPRYWSKVQDLGLRRAIFRGWNDWVAEEYASQAPDRLFPVGAIPTTGIEDAIAEVQHCAELGLHSVVLSSFPNGGVRPSPEDDRFWAASLDANVPVTIHVEIDRSADPDGRLLDYPIEHEDALKQTELAFQVQRFARVGGTNVVQLVLSHLFDRFPKLQIGCLETYLGWVPFFMEMADVRYNRHIHWSQKLLGFEPLKAMPSEIIKEHFYWGFQQDRAGIELRHHMGVDKLMWAADFPHQESDWPHSDKVIAYNFHDVPEDEVRMMTVTNAQRFYHIG
ncbi:MAG: amidohydrolase family protein [Dehalococcoidia bacterium]